MKRVKVLITVTKEYSYDFNELYESEDNAIDKAYTQAIEHGEIKHTNLEDVTVEELVEEYEGEDQ